MKVQGPRKQPIARMLTEQWAEMTPQLAIPRFQSFVDKQSIERMVFAESWWVSCPIPIFTHSFLVAPQAHYA
jgi:hypothetical protein